MGVTLFDSVLDLAKAGKIAGMDADARQEQLEAQQNVQRALLNFEEAIQKIRNKIFNQLLDSGLFDKFAEIMGKLQNKFTDFMNKNDYFLTERNVNKVTKFLNFKNFNKNKYKNLNMYDLLFVRKL